MRPLGRARRSHPCARHRCRHNFAHRSPSETAPAAPALWPGASWPQPPPPPKHFPLSSRRGLARTPCLSCRAQQQPGQHCRPSHLWKADRRPEALLPEPGGHPLQSPKQDDLPLPSSDWLPPSSAPWQSAPCHSSYLFVPNPGRARLERQLAYGALPIDHDRCAPCAAQPTGRGPCELLQTISVPSPQRYQSPSRGAAGCATAESRPNPQRQWPPEGWHRLPQAPHGRPSHRRCAGRSSRLPRARGRAGRRPGPPRHDEKKRSRSGAHGAFSPPHPQAQAGALPALLHAPGR
mmetsp:Transcript_106314/g.227015  ORF Transcript_106314/g.227015 Transcript_106314/m.227015 type:complete len:292 (+) Transcript_106314:2249-3124(+)